MSLLNRYFLDTIKNKYLKFNGRASRSEFWYYALFYLIANIVIALIDTYVVNPMLGIIPEQAGQGGILQMVFSLGLLLPSIAIGIRRLHDTGKSGWWYLLALIPIIGWLVLLFFYIQDSRPGSNQYGDNPKGL